MKMRNAGYLVVLSGGMDSATLLGESVADGRRTEAISFNYGQRHSKELEFAAELAKYYQVSHTIVDLRPVGQHLKGSALTDDIEVPHGLYDADNMAVTVVPNRNMIFLSAAVGIAQSRGLGHVVTAVHAGDYVVYPDCRPEFIETVAKAAELATHDLVTVRAPYVYMSKADICHIGYLHKVPFELAWSCYEGGEIHCGQCGTCVERIEAFILANVEDPTVYAPGAKEWAIQQLREAGKLD